MGRRLGFGIAILATWSSGAQSGGPLTIDERIQAAPVLWERSRAEFNELVLLGPAEVTGLRNRLARTEDHAQRRGLFILLSVNCALPSNALAWRQLQAYRCEGTPYTAFRNWALSPQGDVYALAFAKPTDRAAAVTSLRMLLTRADAKPVEQVDDKEFLSELIGYLEAGGLP